MGANKTKTRGNIKRNHQTGNDFNEFAHSWFILHHPEKSIIGKQHGQGGGKWGPINLRQESRRREN